MIIYDFFSLQMCIPFSLIFVGGSQSKDKHDIIPAYFPKEVSSSSFTYNASIYFVSYVLVEWLQLTNTLIALHNFSYDCLSIRF